MEKVIDVEKYPLEALLIWQASALAFQNKFKEAEELLKCLESSDESILSVYYDLIGRIRVGQRHYDEARSYFQKAISYDPCNQAPKEALNALPKLIKLRKMLKPVLALSILIVAVGVIGVLKTVKHAGAPIAVSTPFIARSEESRSNDGSFPLINWHENLRLTGVDTVIENNKEIKIVFNEGIYSQACEFAPGSQDILKQIAERIGGHIDQVMIIIEGHADQLPVFKESPFKNNFNLALERARKVADFFQQECKVPHDKLIYYSCSDQKSPFENQGEKEMLKNRTVTIRIRVIN